MGAYGSRPIMKLEADTGSDKFITFCTGAVQGWRISQEDAHLNKLIFDNEIQASVFGVFDGHGGSEVAKYVSDKFVDVIKLSSSFKADSIDPVKALETTFLEIDTKVADPNTKKELEELMTDEEDSETDEDEEEEVKALHDEADMPIDDIIKKYGDEEKMPEATKELLEKRRKSMVNKKEKSDEKSEPKEESKEEKSEANGEDAAQPKDDDEDDEDFKPEKAKEVEVEESSANDEEESDEDDDEDDDDDDDEDDDDSDDSSEDESGMNIDQFMTGDSSPGFSSGTTACVCLLIPDLTTNKVRLFTANVGDSRAVLCRDNKAIDLSIDHKPTDKKEIDRIKNAGGSVNDDGRVNGGLNLSRAIGDHNYKKREDLSLSEQMISSHPDLSDIELDAKKDKFVVIACDGIWNSLTSQEVIDFINARLDDKSLIRKCRKPVHLLKESSDEDSSEDDEEFDDEEAAEEHEKKKKEKYEAKQEAKKAKKEAANGNGNHASNGDSEDVKPMPTDEQGILSEICEDLFHHVLSEKANIDSVGCDNMTCTIVMLKDLEGYAKEAKVKLAPVTLPLPDQTVNTTDVEIKKRKMPEENSSDEQEAKKVKTE